MTITPNTKRKRNRESQARSRKRQRAYGTAQRAGASQLRAVQRRRNAALDANNTTPHEENINHGNRTMPDEAVLEISRNREAQEERTVDESKHDEEESKEDLNLDPQRRLATLFDNLAAEGVSDIEEEKENETSNDVTIFDHGNDSSSNDENPLPAPILIRRRVRRRRMKIHSAKLSLDNLDESVFESHVLLKMDVLCEYCNARLWQQELYKRHSPCCNNGTCGVPFTPWPNTEDFQWYKSLFKNRDWCKQILRFNVAFQFSSLETKALRPVPGRGPRPFTIEGAMYHNIGPMESASDSPKRYAQIFVIGDSEIQLAARRGLSCVQGLDVNILRRIQRILLENNPYARLYYFAHEILRQSGDVNSSIILRSMPGRTHNLPTCDEIAILIDGAEGATRERQVLLHSRDVPRLGSQLPRNEHAYDIVLHGPSRNQSFIRINESNCHYDPLLFPLLFMIGEPGWSPYQTWRNREGKVRKMTLNDHVKFLLFQRETDMSILHLAGKLFQMYTVIQFAKMEDNRLRWHITHQESIRQDSYQAFADAVARRNNLQSIGIKTILPSTFYGSVRYMQQQYQDAIAIMRKYGKPDLFITVTCNPKWAEIEEVFNDQKGEMGFKRNAQDRMDIVCRVFNQKLSAIEEDLYKNHVLGRVVAFVRVMEFQKRGLPHAHILIILDEHDKFTTTDLINTVVCAEIPNPERYPMLHKIVTSNMIHKCSTDRCLKNNKCDKGFPHNYCEETTEASDGYPKYRRRRTPWGSSDEFKNNRYVVPYNPVLLLKYNCHMNVEICSSISSVKYIYKYIHKGQDRASYSVESEIDEIKAYQDARYVSTCEAVMRILNVKLFLSSHSIHRLAVHLEGEQCVRFAPTENEDDALHRLSEKQTTLMAFFHLCQTNAIGKDGVPAKSLLYSDIPSYFTWETSQGGLWRPRKQRGEKAIGRIYSVSPRQGEKFYLRMLLCHRRGPTSFTDLRTVNGFVHDTYKMAANALGLLQTDDEWTLCLSEAATWKMPYQLRDLFVIILVHADPHNALDLWNTFVDEMSEDYKGRLLPNEDPNRAIFQTLQSIDDLLRSHGDTWCLSKFPTLPQLHDFTFQEFLPNESENRLIAMERAYDLVGLEKTLEGLTTMSEEQRAIFTAITTELDKPATERSQVFFLCGEGGSGKSFVSNLLLAHVRSKRQIAVATASTGLAALNLEGGTTAHSRFKIPLSLESDTSCFVTKQSHLAELLKETTLFIWDECSMMHKHAIEAVSRLLCDLCDDDRPFGGKTFLFSGDFKQTPPVVSGGSREQIINASMKKSSIWNNISVYSLKVNFRALNDPVYSQTLRKIGNGTYGKNELGERDDGDFGEDYILLPDNLVLKHDGCSPLSALIDNVYNGLNTVNATEMPEYLGQRAILCPKNDSVDKVNEIVLSKFTVRGEQEKVYLSADSVKSDGESDAMEVDFPVEFLNQITVPGFPMHRLHLKVNSTIMLLRNLCPIRGLCNGTRLTVNRLKERCIEATILTGSFKGKVVFIPRITLLNDPPNNTLPFVLIRRQFPVRLAFAMTITKSQGQTVPKVGVFLPEPVFAHGQLYVAMSRVKLGNNIKILPLNSELEDGRVYTKNIVYPELLDESDYVIEENLNNTA